ncbi:unnamed protein product [Didymodactylos carnosus]|uniref:Uncharacterized protein n=1 Tax=Didymodactylos carnosus TaxID=1234261 RepID=A0A815MUY0_9BILA|nr:unnamed protein product [Didymodactylos carnosus]CAF4307730.1 unnamed protein product [Didymodactylos carnosus]
MVNVQNEPSLLKKVIFSYFPNAKRPPNAGTRKRWEKKIMEDLEKFGIKNWRRDTLNRDLWRDLINAQVQSKPVHPQLKQLVKNYKDKADERRAIQTQIGQGNPPKKVIEVLVKNMNGLYTCPNCNRAFKPQEITGHARTCAKKWCKKNNIIGCK